MSQNRVSGVLPADVKDQIHALLDQAKALMPFLVALTPADRRSMLRLGDRSEAFVRRAQYMANRHPGILSRDFDLQEMNSDIELYFALRDVQQAVTHFTELLDDTVAAAGADAFSATLDVYGFAKLANADGLDELRALMARRFSAQGPARPTPEPEVLDAGT